MSQQPLAKGGRRKHWRLACLAQPNIPVRIHQENHRSGQFWLIFQASSGVEKIIQVRSLAGAVSSSPPSAPLASWVLRRHPCLLLMQAMCVYWHIMPVTPTPSWQAFDWQEAFGSCCLSISYETRKRRESVLQPGLRWIGERSHISV